MALVGRYETFQQLGKGPTGAIYRARDIVLGREVALRILNSNARFSSRLLDLFFTDEQSASEWLHPNIATIHDLGELSVGPFIATELLAGITFRKYSRESAKLSLEQKLDFFAQACAGLAHAHRNGVVHAAITPGSFLIDDRQQIKILDLGIRHVGRSLPPVGENFGDLDYLAPEQVWEKSCDTRSDIFSAAVVFYEFLAGVHPFAGGFVPRRVMENEPQALLAHDPSLPRALQDVLAKALSKAPAQRPQSALEFAAMFRSIEREANSTVMQRFGDRPRFPNRNLLSPGKSWEGHPHVRSFLELLRQFDESLSSGNWDKAQESLQSMKSLSSVPDDAEFVPAILDCERRLKQAQASVALPASIDEGADVHMNAMSGQSRQAGMPSQVSRFFRGSQELFTRSREKLAALPSLGLQMWVLLRSQFCSYRLPFIASYSRQGRREAVVARAQVSSSETSLQELPNTGSRSLTRLKRGSWVNILNRVPTRTETFVLAQFVSSAREQFSGYVRVKDLNQWRSDDPESAWNLVLLGKPSDTSPAVDVEHYLAEVQSYSARFPTSPEADAADIETRYWRQLLTRSGKAQVGAPGDSSPASAEAGRPAPLVKPALETPTPLPPVDQEKLQRLLAQIPPLWDEAIWKA